MSKPPNPVKINISFLYLSLLIFLTKNTPNNNPEITAGTSVKLIFIDSRLIVSQTHMWKGTLKRFIIKKSQAAVPMNSFLGSFMAKK